MLAHVLAAEMGVTFRKVAPGRLKPADVERAIFRVQATSPTTTSC